MRSSGAKVVGTSSNNFRPNTCSGRPASSSAKIWNSVRVVIGPTTLYEGGTFVVEAGAIAGGRVFTVGAESCGYACVPVAGTVPVAGGHSASSPSGTGPGPVEHGTVCCPGAVGVVCPAHRMPGTRRRRRNLRFMTMVCSQFSSVFRFSLFLLRLRPCQGCGLL